MPELPEVETIKRDLASTILSQTIVDIEVRDQRVLHHIRPHVFKKKLIGQTFQDVKRRGKGLIFELNPKLYLFVQVKMTGYFVVGEKSDSKETKVIFQLSNGQYLNYNDHRLFGWFFVVDDLKKISYLQTIGPEPLESEFNADWLKTHLKKRTSPIKTLLLNQHFVAGIGNIYASEILFSAKVDPRKKSNRLTQKQTDLVYQSTVRILKDAIEYRGTSMRNYRDSKGEKGTFMNRIQVYGKEGQSCPECQGQIQRIVQAQRSTFFCRTCQK